MESGTDKNPEQGEHQTSNTIPTSMGVPNVQQSNDHSKPNQQNGSGGTPKYPKMESNDSNCHTSPEFVGFQPELRPIPGEESELTSLAEYDSSIDHRLPETVKLITTTEGVKIYLIGTAHYSEESQNDVKMIMEAVKPQAVLVELCKFRADILKFDDNSVLLAQNISFSYIIDTIKKSGAYIGLFHLLLIHITAKLSDQLDMLPGGEFRRAFKEAQKIPNCPVYLADRPLNITIQRTVSHMSLYEMLRFFVMLMTMSTEVSKEDVELHKHQSQVNEFEAKLKAHFPALNEVFVRERDMYLSYMFQACIAHRRATFGETPRRVVGVVGLGHSSGIIKNWGKVSIEDAQRLLSIPPEKQSTKILRFTFKATLIGAFAYMGYRYIPFPSSFVLKSLKSSVEGLKHFGLFVSGRLL